MTTKQSGRCSLPYSARASSSSTGIVLNVALPAIGQMPRLFVDVLEGQNYIQYGYLLSLSALLILAGALSDYYGRRRMFIIGLSRLWRGVTAVRAGAQHGAADPVPILQGAAGALLVPGSLAILTNAFPGEEQGRAFGIWAGASGRDGHPGAASSAACWSSTSRWRAIFLHQPAASSRWPCGRRGATSRRVATRGATGHFDWLGALLVALAVGGLVVRRDLRPAAAVGATAGVRRRSGLAPVSRSACRSTSHRARHPLVPLSMFRSRNFSVTNLSTLLIYGALYVPSSTFQRVPERDARDTRPSCRGPGQPFPARSSSSSCRRASARWPPARAARVHDRGAGR